MASSRSDAMELIALGDEMFGPRGVKVEPLTTKDGGNKRKEKDKKEKERRGDDEGGHRRRRRHGEASSSAVVPAVLPGNVLPPTPSMLEASLPGTVVLAAAVPGVLPLPMADTDVEESADLVPTPRLPVTATATPRLSVTATATRAAEPEVAEPFRVPGSMAAPEVPGSVAAPEVPGSIVRGLASATIDSEPEPVAESPRAEDQVLDDRWRPHAANSPELANEGHRAEGHLNVVASATNDPELASEGHRAEAHTGYQMVAHVAYPICQQDAFHAWPFVKHVLVYGCCVCCGLVFCLFVCCLL